MSVEVLTAIVGAAFLLVLLLKVLRDKCVKKDHEESEYYVMVVCCSTGLYGMCFFLLYLFLSASPAVKGILPLSLWQLLPHPSSPPIPGPPCRFLIDNMAELMHDHLPIHLTSLAKRYGNIYRLKCGNTSNRSELDIQK